MSKKSLLLTLAVLVLSVVSCDEPETVVTNFVHPDGSITRLIEMRATKDDIKLSKCPVPVDSTWSIRDSLEITKKGDTTFVRRAEKTFLNYQAINDMYLKDSSSNKGFNRSVTFRKSFRWFHNVYRFSEIIGKTMKNGYPVSNFMNPEELDYFYSPESLRSKQGNGPDSLKYKSLADSVSSKSDRWLFKSILSEWIAGFSSLAPEVSFSELKSNEDRFLKLIMGKYEKTFDSLWENGTVLKDFIGEEKALKYKSEADTALNVAVKIGFNDFKDYSVRVVMPGKLTSTNGYIDGSKVVLWPVKSDYFLTDRYEMWAESKITNVWAWVVSGLFLFFVLAGLAIRITRRD